MYREDNKIIGITLLWRFNLFRINIDNALDVLSIHCPIVVIKLGQKGLIGKINSTEKKILRISSYNINVLDTICCGDCFDAGFLYSYLNGFSFEESLRFGNACGGLQATKLGSYKFKNIKEIKEFVNNNNLREENNAKIWYLWGNTWAAWNLGNNNGRF